MTGKSVEINLPELLGDKAMLFAHAEGQFSALTQLNQTLAAKATVMGAAVAAAATDDASADRILQSVMESSEAPAKADIAKYVAFGKMFEHLVNNQLNSKRSGLHDIIHEMLNEHVPQMKGFDPDRTGLRCLYDQNLYFLEESDVIASSEETD